MHIMEGFLPAKHALAWGLASLPCVVLGLRSVKRKVRADPELKLLLGVTAAFAFVLTALKIPSVTGSSSHPTGTGLGAVLFGPLAMAPIATIVLLFQALLLAHGGLTTLGANIFSLGVVGPLVACGLFRLSRLLHVPSAAALFLAAVCADLATYLTTSFQLALAFPDQVNGFAGAFIKFSGIFALTQVPLAFAEGVFSVLIFNQLSKYSAQELGQLGMPSARQGARL